MTCIFDLPSEILYQILRFLPMQDLLLCQRVCRLWRTAIIKSTALQEALFLSPRTPEVYWKYTYFHAGPTSISSTTYSGINISSAADILPASHIPDLTHLEREVFAKCRVGTEPFSLQQMNAALHGDPVLDTREFLQRRCILGEHNPMFLALDSSFSIWTIVRETGTSFLRLHPRNAHQRGRLCRAMFLTQPPARRLTFTWKFEHAAFDYLWISGEISEDGGVTVADVIHEVEALECALQKTIVWDESYVVIDGPLCPSEEQEREYERGMNEDAQCCS